MIENAQLMNLLLLERYHRDIDRRGGVSNEADLTQIIKDVQLPGYEGDYVSVTTTRRQLVCAPGEMGGDFHVCMVEDQDKIYVRGKQPYGNPPKGVSDKLEYQIPIPKNDEAAREAAIEKALVIIGGRPDKMVSSPYFLKERVATIFNNNDASRPAIMVAGDRCTIPADQQKSSRGNLPQDSIMQVIEVKLTGVPLHDEKPPYDILWWALSHVMASLPADIINSRNMSKAAWVQKHMKSMR